MYLTAGVSSFEMKITGVTIDSETTSIGGGLAFGDRVDCRSGAGNEQRLGFTWIDVEVSLGNVKLEDDFVDLDYALDLGFGDGITAGFRYSTDTNDMFSGNSYGFILQDGLGAGFILATQYTYTDSVTDANNSTQINGFSIWSWLRVLTVRWLSLWCDPTLVSHL